MSPGSAVGQAAPSPAASAGPTYADLAVLADGTPLAVAAACRLRPACDRLIAVLRPGASRLAELLGAAGCETLFCDQADAGMGHSLAAVIRATPGASGWVVALADMPFIATSSHQLVAAALRPRPPRFCAR